MIHRFFLSPDCFRDTQVTFPAETARQMRQVLRLRPGEMVTALDGCGWEYSVRLEKLTNDGAWGTSQGRQRAEGEPVLQLVLYLSLTQREKFEWALQKCTEVGVSTFVPVISERTLARDKDQAMQKMERWRRILKEAAEQSGRGLVPSIHPPVLLENALQEVQALGISASFLWEEEQQFSMHDWLQEQAATLIDHPQGPLGLFVGPEGGYSSQEADRARQTGIRAVTLGRRILRMETAAVVSAAITLHHFEGG